MRLRKGGYCCHDADTVIPRYTRIQSSDRYRVKQSRVWEVQSARHHGVYAWRLSGVERVGFSFGAIATGFIASEKQAEVVADYCNEQAAQGTTIFVDPIMGDEGKLYNGVTESTIISMRRMVSVAHLIVPNYTEACYLTDTPFVADPVSLREAYRLTDSLRRIGARSVIITSMKIEAARKGEFYNAVVGYNAAAEEYFCLPYNEIPVRFPGTGDIFSSVLFGHLLKGEELENSTQKAMDVVAKMIFLSKDQKDKFRGIPIEKYLSLL